MATDGSNQPYEEYGTFEENEDGVLAGPGEVDAGGKSTCGACTTCLLGLLLFPAALSALGWNEKNTICQNRLVTLAEDTALVGDCSNSADVEGKFAFFSCPMNESKMHMMTPMTSFNLPGLKEVITVKSPAGAQRVEMFQCIETEEKADSKKSKNGHGRRRVGNVEKDASALEDKADMVRTGNKGSKDSSGDEPVYRYRMGWSDVYYDSSQFKATPQNIQASGCPDFVYNGQVNHNPPLPDRGDGQPVELGRQFITATSVGAGAYTVHDEEQMKVFTAEESVSLAPFAASFSLPNTTDNIVTAINTATMAVHPSSQHYLNSCKSDRLGCIRISYNKSSATHVSVLGLVQGAGVTEPYPVDKSWACPAGTLIWMMPEDLSKEELVSGMKTRTQAIATGIRVVGLILAWLGLYCIFDPIATAANTMGAYAPSSLTSALEGVLEMFLCVISCGFGMSCGLLVIAVVWLTLNPTIGVPLLLCALLLMFVGFSAQKMASRDPKRMRKVRKPYAEQQPYGQTNMYA